MHSVEIRAARILLAIAVSLFLLAAPALGGDRPWEQARWHALEARLISNGEGFSSGKRWLESQTQTDERSGFEYTRSLGLSRGREFVFSIQGPLIADEAPGLAFELRF